MLHEGLKNWRAIGTKTETTRFIAFLAEAYLLANRMKEGLRVVGEALSFNKETEDRFYQSELLRLRGELELNHKSRSARGFNLREAESYFLEAIKTARGQQARSFELRATTSLCRLWQKTGKEKEAKRILAKIYGWFTEGFDTPDLKAAKQLLNELR